jgi:hypothetical protein
VTITLPLPIDANRPYGIVIDASNINGLRMRTVAYTFMHLDVEGGTVAPPVDCIVSEPEEPSDSSRRPARRDDVPARPDDSWPEIIPTVVRRRSFRGARGAPVGFGSAPGGALLHRRGSRRCSPHALRGRGAGCVVRGSTGASAASGALDASQPRFLPDDSAVRAAFATVLVRLRSSLTPDPTVPVEL